MKRNVKKILVLMVLSLVGFSAFGCDIMFDGRWYEDVPCCVAHRADCCRKCGKLSLKEFNKVNELIKEMDEIAELMPQLDESEELETIREKFNALDIELKKTTGLSYVETTITYILILMIGPGE